MSKDQIEQIKQWIVDLEDRAHKLLAFDVEVLTAPEREAAASRHLTTIGRFHELLLQLEAQEQQAAPSEDDPMVMHALIFGKDVSQH